MSRIGRKNGAAHERAREQLLQLAAAEARRRATARSGEPERVPLSDIQEAFLVGRQLASRGDRVGCHAYLEFEVTDCDPERLRAALQQVVDLHEMLRAVVEEEGYQWIRAPGTPVPLTVHDLRGASPETRARALAETRSALSHKVYAPGQWPLLEVHLSLLDDGPARVHVSIDEWIADAASMSLLLGQWKRLYEGSGAPRPPETTFREVIALTRRAERSERFGRDLEYWRTKLGDMPGGPQLAPRSTVPQDGHRFERTRLVDRLSPEEWAGLEELARRERLSTTSLVLTLFCEVLEGSSAGGRFSLVMTVADRAHRLPGIEEVVGPLVSTSVFVWEGRAQRPSFGERSQAVQAQLWEMLEHGSVSGVRALRELKSAGTLERGMSLPVVFTSMLHSVGQRSAPGWFEEQRYGVTQTPQVYLDHHVIERGGTLETNWDVSPEWFGPGRVEALFSQYCAELHRLCAVRDINRFTVGAGAGPRRSSDVQQALMLDRVQAGTASAAVICQEFAVESLDPDRMAEAWRQVIRDHAALRTVLESDGMVRELPEAPPYRPSVFALPAGEPLDAGLSRVRAELMRRVFPLGSWPSFELALSQPSTGPGIVHLVVDPAVADGPELQRVALALLDRYLGRPSRGAWPRGGSGGRRQGPGASPEDARRYWIARHAELPGGPRLPGLDAQAAEPPRRLAVELSGVSGLRALADRWGASLDALLLTVYLDVVREWCGGDDFSCVFVDWNGEGAASGGPRTGFRWIRYEGAHAELRDRVRAHQAQLEADRRHGAVSGLVGLRERARRSGGAVPAFGCIYTALLPSLAPEVPSGVTVLAGGSSTPGVALDCIGFEDGDRLELHWDARIAAEGEGIVTRSFDRFEAELRRLAGGAAGAEAPAALTASSADFVPVHRGFERTAARFPDRVAVCFRDRRLTYAELDAEANRLARVLRQMGAGPERLVALFLDRSVELVVAILATLKAGAAYLPLDVRYPRERVRNIAADAEIAVLVTTGAAADELAIAGVPTLRVDGDAARIASERADRPEVEVGPENAAYVIYTSGSTGRPKGVVIEHRNVGRLFTSTDRWYGFDEHDVWTLFHSHAFDFSVWEIWGALLHGGRLVVVPYETSRSFDAFHALLVDEGVTVLNQTPTAFRYLLDADARSPRSQELRLRFVVFGGEKLEPYTLAPWFARHGERTRLVNMYGITETTVHVTYRVIRPTDLSGPSLIGEPIPDLELLLLDERRRPVEDGQVGEIYVGGAGVARGYLHRPELNAERFVRLREGGPRFYKSGDLARRLADGELEFIGRSDHQVQLRGFRVELGEIEATVCEMDGVAACAVLVAGEQSGDPKVVAFVVARGEMPEASQLRQFVRRTLPDYMIPNVVVPVPRLPLTPEGKLDRRALLAMAPGAEEPAAAPPVAVRDEWVKRVAATAAAVLGAPEVAVGADLFDLGATSLTLVNLASKLTKELGVAVPVEVLLQSPTVQAIADHLRANAPHAPATAAASVVAAGGGRAAPPAPATALPLEAVLAIFREALRVEVLDPDQDLFDAGATSLTLVNAVRRIEQLHAVKVPIELLLERPQARAVVEHVARQQPAAPPPPRAGVVALPRDERLGAHAPGASALGLPVEASRLDLEALESALALFGERHAGDRRRRLYATAGGKYAVDVYVAVARVEGLERGLYLYDPVEHALRSVEGAATLDDGAVGGEAPGEAPARLHFVLRLEALSSTYGSFAHPLGVLEAGYMVQLLAGQQERLGLRVFPVRPPRRWLDEGDRVCVSLGLGGSSPNPTRRSAPLSAREPALAQAVSWADVESLSGPFRLSPTEGTQRPRRVGTAAAARPLKAPLADERSYLVRATQRAFTSGQAIEARELGGLLELLRGGSPQGAFHAALSGASPVEIVVYLKAGAVAGATEGFYRYDPAAHELVRIAGKPGRSPREALVPFNRAHFDRCAAAIYFLVDADAAQRSWGESGLHQAMVQVGRMSQLLMENQSAYGVGLVPIGGQTIERWKTDLGLAGRRVLAHCLLAGAVKHEAPLDGPMRFLSGLRAGRGAVPGEPRRPVEATRPGELAIVGISGRYPGAADLDGFWENVVSGRVSTAPSRSPAGGGGREQVGVARTAGYLADVAAFDSLAFHIAPSEARQMDPQERLVLESVWECLENAGHTSEDWAARGVRVGVFVGAMWSDYQSWAVSEWERTGEAGGASLHSSIANRVSWFFDFRGVSLAVNTSCSSALTAVALAADALERGDCDVAVVSGVNLITHPYHHDSLRALGLLAADGVGRAYDERASGLVPGEGVGTLLLRRASDAQADGDFLYATLKAAALNHGGRTSRYAMPRPEIQAEAIERCCRKAGIHPGTVSHVETAAAGSGMADAAEVEAIVRALGASGGPCTLGTVKPIIGHLESASGVSQITKVLFQMRTGRHAPGALGRTDNPLLRLGGTRFRFARGGEAWAPAPAPRRAIVNAFSATGSNATVLLEEAQPREADPGAPRPTLIVLSSNTREQLVATAERTAHHLRQGAFRPASLADVAETLARGRRHLPVRAALVVSSLEELGRTLDACVRDAFVVPGVHTSFTPAPSAARTEAPLERAARAYVAGEEPAWSSVLAPGGRRTPLPGYTFRAERHWLESAERAERQAPRPPPGAEATPARSEAGGEAPSRASAAGGVDRILPWLSRIYAEVSGIAADQLDAGRALEEYGLSSQQVVALTARLKERGVPAAPTLWFQCVTLRDAACALLEAHEADLGRVLGPAPGSPAAPPHEAGTPGTAAPSRGSTPGTRLEKLAVVGLAGRYPGATDVWTFGRNLREGRDAVSEVPSGRWDHQALVTPSGDGAALVRCRWGGFLERVDQFDPLFFRMSQTEAERTDPQERLFLQTAWEALEDAGYARDELARVYANEVGVFVGVMYNEYALHGAEAALRGRPVALGASAGSIANRVSYFLGLRGPSLAVDTMCSSSLMALHLAAESIWRGECRAAIAGGANLSLHPNKYLMQSQLNMLSATGHCHAFGAGADGFVPAEAVGAVMLKPLADALRDGDHVYGVLRATAVNHDGRKNGYTVPNPTAQAELVRAALARAGARPEDISYIEAHGTGTSLGDPIEVAGLARAFEGCSASHRCAIGSVKSNIGHPEAAAGIASLTKVLLQFHHGELFPSLHAEPANPRVALEGTPFRVQTRREPWVPVLPGGEERARCAGISAFGAGGVNVHVIVEEPPRLAAYAAADARPQLVVLSAKDEERLTVLAGRMAEVFQEPERWFGAATPATTSSSEATGEDDALHAFRAELAAVLAVSVDDVDLDVRLEDLELHGTQLQALQRWLAEARGVKLDARELYTAQSLRALVGRVAEAEPRPHQAPARVGPARHAVPCLQDVAFTLQVGREPLDARLAFVATGFAQAGEALAQFAAGRRTDVSFVGDVRAVERRVRGWFEGEEAARFLEELTARGQLARLGELWTHGLAFDWHLLHRTATPRRVTLPTYPFAQTVCWPIERDTALASAVRSGPAARVESPADRRETDSGAEAPAAQPSRGGPLPLLRQKLAKILGHSEDVLLEHVVLGDVGYDSVAAVKLKHELERKLRLELPLAELDGGQSIGELAARLARMGCGGAGAADAAPAPRHVVPPAPSQVAAEATVGALELPVVGIEPQVDVVAGASLTGDALEQLALEQLTGLPEIVPEPDRAFEPFSLLPMQQAFLAGKILAGGDQAAGCHLYLELLFETLDLARLQGAWNRLVAHHGMLSTRVSLKSQRRLTGLEPYRIARGRSELAPGASIDEQLADTRAALSHRGYTRDAWPMFEIRCTELQDGRSVVHLSIDELVVDAASVGLLLAQWERLYEDPAAELPVAEVEFRDYVRALEAFEKTPAFERDLQYWVEKLAEMPDAPALGAAGWNGRGSRQRVQARLAPEELEALRGTARELRTTVNALLLTIFSESIRAHTGQQRFGIVQTFFNRLPLNRDIGGVVGPFTSSMVFVADAPEGSTLGSRALAAQAQCWNDLDHCRVGTVRVLRELKSRGLLRRDFSLPVVFTSTVGAMGGNAGGWFSRRIFGLTQTPQVGLDHQAHEEAGGLAVQWDFAEAWIRPEAAHRLFAGYMASIRRAAARAGEWAAAAGAPSGTTVAPALARRGPELPLVIDPLDGPFALTALQRAYAVARKAQRGDERSCVVFQEYEVRDPDRTRLEAAWRRLVAHHEMLRTVVGADGKQRTLQQVEPYSIEETIAGPYGGEEWSAACEDGRARLFGAVFELGTWPMFGLRLVSTPDRRHGTLQIALDGILADGKSVELLYEQLFQLYRDPAWPLAPLGLRFRDVVRSRQEFGASPAGQEARAWWNERLARLAPAPILPPARPGAGRGRVRWSTEVEAWPRLVERARAMGVAPSTILLAAYVEAIAFAARDPGFTVVAVHWERPVVHPDVEQLVGDFSSLSWIERDPRAIAFEDRVRVYDGVIAQDLRHAGVSGVEVLAERMLRARKFEGYPVVFTQPLRQQGSSLPESVRLGRAQSRTPQVRLDHLCVERDGRMQVDWDVSGAEYDEGVLRAAYERYVSGLARLGSEEEAWKASRLLGWDDATDRGPRHEDFAEGRGGMHA